MFTNCIILNNKFDSLNFFFNFLSNFANYVFEDSKREQILKYNNKVAKLLNLQIMVLVDIIFFNWFLILF